MPASPLQPGIHTPLKWAPGFRIRLLGLCFLAMAAIAVMEIRSAHDDTEQGFTELKARAGQLVTTANAEYDNGLDQSQMVMDFMLAAPEGTADECGVYADKIKQRYPWILGLGTISADGKALCGEAARRHLSIADQGYFRQAVATRKVTLSDLHIGPISHKPVVTMVKPLLDANGQILRFAVVGLDLKQFNTILEEKKLAEDTTVTIFDSSGTILGHSVSEPSSGTNVKSHPLFQAIAEQHTGQFEGVGLDGLRRLYAFRPFWGDSTYIAVGILEQPVVDRIHEKLIKNLLVLFGTVLAATLISMIAAEVSVFAPSRRLILAARAVGEGKFEAMAGFTASMPEMADMLAAFQEMAGKLQVRESELKRSEAATGTINRNLTLGEQIANAGYWRIDYPERRVTWSDGTYRIFGLDRAIETVGLATAIDFYHPEDRKLVVDAVEKAVNLQRDFEYTARIVHADGELRYVQSRGFCEIGANGAFSALFGAVIDVTVQKETEARLQLARQAAETANTAKSTFLSSMSHELRTPLTSIIGFSDLMLMRTRSAEMKRYLQLQREAGQHLLKLISDILDHSKIEAGKLHLEAIAFDLPELVNGCVAVMNEAAAQKGLILNSSVGIAIPRMLIGDPNRLKQILLNLISNAIKFTSQGSVTLTVEPTGSAGDVIAMRFLVTDTGPGIPAGKLGLMFQRFSQADVSTTRRYGGTGLGLAISKELVEAMGGTIGVESVPGRGSSFWFSLRLLAATAPKPAPVVKAKAHQQKSRILLAEDSPVNQLLFTELLETLGHKVVSVNDGAAAVAAIGAGHKFDLVLMDMQMPVMDGLTATQRIRENNHSRLPIVGLTANAMQDDIDRCLAAGMNAHLAKPVDITMLVDVIHRVMAADPSPR